MGINWINKDISKIASKKQLEGTNPVSNIWISASAGSGKTKVLINRLLRLLLCDGVNVNNILCITFTNAGASEMKNRLMKHLSNWAKLDNKSLVKELSILHGRELREDEIEQEIKKAKTLFYKIIDTAHGLKIQTIHSFCQSLLSRFPLESGISIDYKLLEDKKLLSRDIFKIFIKNDIEKYRKYLKSVREDYIVESIEKTLNGLKLNFLEEFKKTTFDEKLQNIKSFFNVESNQKVCEKFVNSLINDNDFLTSLGRRLKTTKSDETKLKLEKLINAIECNNYEDIFNTIIKNEQIDAKVISKTSYKKGFVGDLIDEFRIDLSKIKIKHEALERVSVLDFVIRNYEFLKKEKSYLDYDDILSKTISLLKLENISQWVLYKTDYGHQHILLDESQDTSFEQWEIVELLTASFFDGSSDNENTIFCVGDEKQSIYGFQGGDPKLFTESKNLYEEKSNKIGKPFKYINLDTSFRTTPIILEVVDNTFSKSEDIISSGEKIKHIACKDELPGYVEIMPLAPNYHTFCDEIVASIENTIGKKYLHSEGRFAKAGDIVILVRDNISDDVLVKKLLNKNIGVSFNVKNDFKDNIVFEDILSFFKFIILPIDNLNLACLLKSPVFNFDDKIIEEIFLNQGDKTLWHALRISKHQDVVEFLNRYLNLLDRLRPSQILQKLLYDKVVNRDLNVLQNFTYRLGNITKENIENIILIIEKIEMEKIPTMQTVVNELVAYGGIQKIDVFNTRDEITISTAHNSKGKEFPIVYLVDGGKFDYDKAIKDIFKIDDAYVYSGSKKMIKDIFEKDKTIDKNKLDIIIDDYVSEELRLLYVGMTRAIEGLIVCGYYKKSGEYTWYNKIINGIENIENAKQITYEPICNSNDWQEFYENKKGEKFKYECLKYVYEKTNEIVFQDETVIEKDEEVEIPNWIFEKPKQLMVNDVKTASNDETVNYIENEYIVKIKNRGIIIHKLYEYINVKNYNNAELITKFLTYKDIVNKNDIENIIKNIKIIYENNNFMTDGEIHKELQIWYDTDDGKIMHSIVDHICIIGDEIYIIDIKTSKHTNNIADSHKKQLLHYIDGVKKIYGDKYKYKAGILYTENGKVSFI